jgi:4-hydroxy-tetrahydrodipicolinate synthase
MNHTFTGTGVALVTPFQNDLSIDFEALERLLDFTAKGGADYYVVQGTTGESVTISASEKASLLKFVKENNKHKLPVMYGLGGNNTQEVLTQLRELDLSGADALLSVSPYYNKPSQEGIFQHFKAIADASPLPVMLYNVPGRTGSNMTAATTLRLATHPNIIGIKEASGDLNQCMFISANMPDDFLLISGDDMLTLPLMTFGAKGAISVLANAFPEKFCSMVKLGMEGNFTEASKPLFDLIELNPLMYDEGNPVGVKAALEERGICSARVRLPLVTASDALRHKINKLIAAHRYAS